MHQVRDPGYQRLQVRASCCSDGSSASIVKKHSPKLVTCHGKAFTETCHLLWKSIHRNGEIALLPFDRQLLWILTNSYFDNVAVSMTHRLLLKSIHRNSESALLLFDRQLLCILIFIFLTYCCCDNSSFIVKPFTNLSYGCSPVLRFFTYVYVHLLNTRQWTSLHVLSTPYVYVCKKKRSTRKQPLLSNSFSCAYNLLPSGVQILDRGHIC